MKWSWLELKKEYWKIGNLIQLFRIWWYSSEIKIVWLWQSWFYSIEVDVLYTFLIVLWKLEVGRGEMINDHLHFLHKFEDNHSQSHAIARICTQSHANKQKKRSGMRWSLSLRKDTLKLLPVLTLCIPCILCVDPCRSSRNPSIGNAIECSPQLDVEIFQKFLKKVETSPKQSTAKMNFWKFPPNFGIPEKVKNFQIRIWRDFRFGKVSKIPSKIGIPKITSQP